MYYVYHLTDPRTDQPFYVGKGKSGRMYAHCNEARRGARSRKCDRIREIQVLGLEVGHLIVERFDEEDDAYAFEAQEILRIGLSALTNEVPGGNGGAADELAWRVVAPSLPGLAKHLRLMERGRSLFIGGENMDGVARDYAHALLKRHGQRFTDYLRSVFGIDAGDAGAYGRQT